MKLFDKWNWGSLSVSLARPFTFRNAAPDSAAPSAQLDFKRLWRGRKGQYVLACQNLIFAGLNTSCSQASKDWETNMSSPKFEFELSLWFCFVTIQSMYVKGKCIYTPFFTHVEITIWIIVPSSRKHIHKRYFSSIKKPKHCLKQEVKEIAWKFFVG